MVRFRGFVFYNRGAMESTFSTHCYRLFSLSPEGRFGVTVVDQTTGVSGLTESLQSSVPGGDLQHYQQLAEAIAFATGTARDTTILLPRLDRTGKSAPASWLSKARPFRVAPGILLCSMEDPGLAIHRSGYFELLLAAAGNGFVSQRGMADFPPLVFHYETTSATAADLLPLLGYYKLPVAAADLPPGEFATTITLEIPGGDLSAWFLSPPQCTDAFADTFPDVSVDVQRSLRHWLRFAWMTDADRFDDLAATRAAMIYWLSNSCRDGIRSKFAWDVLCAKEMNRFYRVASGRVPRELDAIVARLRAGGRVEMAQCYRKLRRREIVAGVRREARKLNRMLTVESNVIDLLVNLTVEARTMLLAGVTRGLLPVSVRYGHELRAHLRRNPIPEWSHDLSLLVMIHATTQLRARLGLESGICARLRVETADGGRSWSTNTRENPACPLALAS